MNIVGEVMKRDEKIDMAHIPLKGAAPLKQELLAGRLQLGGDQLSSSLAEIKRGSLKALATNAPQRLSVLPEVPTDRKSTRLNSSHTVISDAVFCFKKKKSRRAGNRLLR